LHITIKIPGQIPIPTKLYGGTQRVIYWLGKALIELGHQVTLIGPAASCLPGAELRPYEGDGTDPQTWLPLVPDATDILHLQDVANPVAHKPFLVTINGNAVPDVKFHPNTVFVSRKHAANHGARHFVHNGIDPAEYAFSETREDYAVFLAKARWKVKNFDGAMVVARRAGLELRALGSRNWPLNLQRLLPPIRGVRYYGMIGGDEKRDLLARARCLIFPVRWEEPFGLALTESLVSGCYVVGTPYGSLPEIVTPEVGVLSASAAELAEAVRSPQRFTPAVCRDYVLSGGFTHLDMAKKYLRYYEAVLSHGRLVENVEPAPATMPGFVAKQLLPWQE
jgi:glycosyl transferase family 1